MRLLKLWALLTIPAFLVSCSSFNLAEHSGDLSVKKQRRAKDVTGVVQPFAYTPIESDEQDLMTKEDLLRWQEVLADGLNRSNIFADIVRQNGDKVPDHTAYLIDGKIKRFYFKKNWVPTFFPLHLGLSFITLTGYTWAAGPTTVTKIDFQVEVNIKDAKSGEVIKTLSEQFQDTTTMNIYSKDLNNPYGNPNLVFARVIDSLAADMAAALP